MVWVVVVAVEAGVVVEIVIAVEFEIVGGDVADEELVAANGDDDADCGMIAPAVVREVLPTDVAEAWMGILASVAGAAGVDEGGGGAADYDGDGFDDDGDDDGVVADGAVH